MPSKKRANQHKRTSSASPAATTSHGTADQRYHLRHTGPSISTRANASATPSKPPPLPAQTESASESSPTQQGSREKESRTESSSSAARTSLTKLTYVLFLSALFLLGWYVRGMITTLERLKDDVGWWEVIVDDFGGATWWETLKERGFRSDLAEREGGEWSEVKKGSDLDWALSALADALGISTLQVASAVKPVVPPASLTSIASKTEETGGSEAIRILLEDTTRDMTSGAGGAEGTEESVLGERPGKAGAEVEGADNGEA